ncbi:MAG: methylenetetrahydrofolate reductase C-terminal domain-containing protein [Dehalococcoidales bacterium]|nr:methylenetetrahydrofolate reductase C-terminal domain-containing protein [Dehalococcoidales bacterium]
MIVTTQKPVDEILDFIAPYKNIFIMGCDGCTQPPRGIREAITISQLLELAGKLKNKEFVFKTGTCAKQCDSHLAAETVQQSNLLGKFEKPDAILTMACGLGVQMLAGIDPSIPVFPAQNTHFMGAEEREQGTLEERCAGCGDCVLAITGGICPVARCSKGLLNGACGGAKEGKCELSPERPCGWVLIYDRLKAQGKLDQLKELRPLRDYRVTGWKVTV